MRGRWARPCPKDPKSCNACCTCAVCSARATPTSATPSATAGPQAGTWAASEGRHPVSAGIPRLQDPGHLYHLHYLLQSLAFLSLFCGFSILFFFVCACLFTCLLVTYLLQKKVPHFSFLDILTYYTSNISL